MRNLGRSVAVYPEGGDFALATVEESPCPVCGAHGTLRLSQTLQAKPLGTFSLAGAQMKVSAQLRPVLSCTACDLKMVGVYDDDGRHVSFPQPASTG
jgi:hypothetical protein